MLCWYLISSCKPECKMSSYKISKDKKKQQIKQKRMKIVPEEWPIVTTWERSSWCSSAIVVRKSVPSATSQKVSGHPPKNDLNKFLSFAFFIPHIPPLPNLRNSKFQTAKPCSARACDNNPQFERPNCSLQHPPWRSITT